MSMHELVSRFDFFSTVRFNLYLEFVDRIDKDCSRKNFVDQVDCIQIVIVFGTNRDDDEPSE